MGKTLIIASYIEKPEGIERKILSEADYVICADGGWVRARELGIGFDMVLGDFDSSEKPDCPDDMIVEFRAEKDFTDLEAAVMMAERRQDTDITIIGGLGGRLDHTLGNLALLTRHPGITMLDGRNRVSVLAPGRHIIRKDGYKYAGFVAGTPAAANITLRGFKYPLSNYTLRSGSSMCVSNEILRDEGEISFSEGLLIFAQSKE